MDAVTILRMLSKQYKFLTIYFYFITIACLEVDGNRATYEMIYRDIQGVSRCVRRMNATHQIGCTSDLNGNTGVLHHVANEADIDWLIANGTNAPYVTVLSAGMFKRNNLERLIKSGKVSGLLLDHSKNASWDIIDRNEGYSSDRPCPNDNFGLYNGTAYNNCSSSDSFYKWNSEGDSTNFDFDFGIPVFALYNEAEVEDVIKCYEKHNRDMPAYPLCSVELMDFMYGVKDTPTCMWRTQRTSNLESSSYCDPIGDYNVWGYTKTPNKTATVSPPSVVLAAAQLDSTSLFYNPLERAGAESVASSFITLLVAAEAIGHLDPEVKESLTKDIMFTFFNGESYDYIGSTRMVYDMMRGYFPHAPAKKGTEDENKEYLPQLNVTDIAYFLELRQLGLSNGTYFVHVDPLSQTDEIKNQTSVMINSLKKAGLTSNVTIKAPSDIYSTPLPPASFQQFLKSGVKIPGVLLTDHEKEFTNKFYNSRYDTTHNLHIDSNWNNETEVHPLAVRLNKVANAVAKTLVSLAGGDEKAVSAVETDVNTANELLFCFLIQSNCSFFKTFQDKVDAKLSAIPFDFYVGVDIVSAINPVRLYTSAILSYYLGERIPMKKAEKESKCTSPKDSDVYQYFYIVGPKMEEDEGICVKSTVHNTLAVSPAFIDDDHTSPDWASTKYPTWTESQWGTAKMQLRLFLVPSPEQEWVLFSVGIIVLLISFPSVYFVKHKADILFRTDSSL